MTLLCVACSSGNDETYVERVATLYSGSLSAWAIGGKASDRNADTLKAAAVGSCVVRFYSDGSYVVSGGELGAAVARGSYEGTASAPMSVHEFQYLDAGTGIMVNVKEDENRVFCNTEDIDNKPDIYVTGGKNFGITLD